ncbi:MAG: thioredoxin domain-containing protein [Hellea sp.]|nr:thioredoxin domain-containing protein [Hellea sp.]
MAHTVKKFSMISAAILLGLTTTACAKDDQAANMENDGAVQTDTVANDQIEITPVSAPDDQSGHADHDHGADDHGHDHSIAPQEVDIDHVYTIAPDDHVIGAADAANNMIIYASVTCPHCADWFATDWPKIKSGYVETGMLQVAFREIPTNPAQLAATGFVMANCAPDNQYFDMIEYQMAHQDETFAALEDGTIKEKLESLAAKAGLETEEKLTACFDDPSHSDRFQNAGLRMTGAGMQAVPGIIINGETVSGHDKSADHLISVITGKSGR